MEKFEFVYTDQNYLNKLMVICLATLILLFILLSSIYAFEKFTSIWITLISLGIPAGVFFIFKDRIRRSGSVVFDNQRMDFTLRKKQFSIGLDEISGYRLEYYYGASWFIYLHNNTRLKLISYFSNNGQEQFEALLNHFKSEVKIYYNPENQFSIKRHKSNLEQNWILILLAVAVVVVFGSIIYAVAENNAISAVTVMVAIFLVLVSIGYFKNKQKQKS